MIADIACSVSICYVVHPCVIACSTKDFVAIKSTITKVNDIVTFLAVDCSEYPVFTLVDDIIAISTINFLIESVAIISTISSIDDVGITPEVFVEVICSVLVVTEDVFRSSLFDCAVSVHLPPVGADCITACISVEVLVSSNFVATVDCVIPGATVSEGVACDFAANPDLVITLFAVKFLFCVLLLAVCCPKLFTITNDIYCVHCFDVLPVESELICFVIVDSLVNDIISFTCFDYYAAGMFLA